MRQFSAIFFILLLVAGCVHGEVINLRLGPEGEILAWLVAGPFPNPHAKDFITCRGFEKDYLRTEANVQPFESRRELFSISWRLAIGNVENGVDLLSVFPKTGAGVAYLYAGIVSKSDTKARLLLGSDDGVKLWVNGKHIHTSHQTRGIKRDEEQVEVRLKSGVNRLLFKVDQHFGGWGLIARIVGMDGLPIADLKEVLDVKPQPAKEDIPAISILRKAVDKPGCLDVNALNQYIKLAAKARLWIPWLSENKDGALPLRTSLDTWKRRLSASPVSADSLSAVLTEATLDLGGR
ncbi:MAG: hypothetical protein QME62_14385, partial [Armatimonadota bacterium]|nr:hypothetical protein [Armatimonadota bacterium]